MFVVRNLKNNLFSSYFDVLIDGDFCKGFSGLFLSMVILIGLWGRAFFQMFLFLFMVLTCTIIADTAHMWLKMTKNPNVSLRRICYLLALTGQLTHLTSTIVDFNTIGCITTPAVSTTSNRASKN